MAELSVVLISKNQEWNIARLVESVLKETAHLSCTEIILVDSASKDHTTKIAAQYPIKVLKLHSNQHLSASAGRCVGSRHTTGSLVLFLDGDMEICKGWLDQALGIMHTHPDVAVVCGIVIDCPITPPNSTDKPVLTMQTDADVLAVSHGGGAALYRRSVLDQVGTFNPYLYSDEEPELCLRIRHAGYRILRLSHPIVFHYSAPVDGFSSFLLRRNSKMMYGYGQVVRYFLGTPLLLPYLKERGWAIAPALTLTLGITAFVLSVATHEWAWTAIWFGVIILLIIIIAIRKQSLKRAFLAIFRRLLILDGTIHGLLLKPYDPQSYPGTFDTIR